MDPNKVTNTLDLPYWIPLLLITLYAIDRFSTPSENRASTTAVRYYSATVFYIVIYWIGFFVVHKYPLLIELMLRGLGAAKGGAVPSWLNQTSTTLMVAVLLSILLPKIPLLSEIDRKLRIFLQKMADIPIEARRLSKEIQAAPFAIPEQLVNNLQRRFTDQGFDTRDIAIGAGHPAKQRWTRISVLLLSLEKWETDAGVSPFMQERQNQYRRIKERHQRLLHMAKSCFDLSRSESEGTGDDIISKASAKFHASFMDEADDLLGGICDFISQGVLRCRLTRHSRVAAMAQMGFQLDRKKAPDVLNPNRVVGFFGFLLLMLMFNFILIIRPEQDRDVFLLKITMIVSIYVSAVIFGVAPKEKWALFMKDENGQLPFAGYLLSGVMAAASAIGISLAFKTLIFARGDTQICQAFLKAWDTFLTESYPFMLMAFSTAALIGYQLDLRLPPSWPDWSKRLANGIIQGMGTTASAILVFWLLQSIHQPPPLGRLIQISFLIGFAIGFVVPCWYWRGACKRQSAQWPASEKELPAPAAGG